MNDSDKLYKLLDCELDKIAAKPELNDALLSNLYKLVDVKKDLLEIEKKSMELDEMDSGSSYRVSYPGNDSGRMIYRRGGNSNRRGGSRYYGGGYSMDEGSDALDYLEDAMSHARSEQEREIIRQAMMKLDK